MGRSPPAGRTRPVFSRRGRLELLGVGLVLAHLGDLLDDGHHEEEDERGEEAVPQVARAEQPALARVDGRRVDATDLYDTAIGGAREGGFLSEEAIANELAGRFHRGRGSDTLARSYLAEARDLYDQWGATTKVAPH